MLHTPLFSTPSESAPQGFARHTLNIAKTLTLLLPICMFIGKAPVDVACSLIGVLFLVTHVIRKDYGWLQTPWVRIVLIFWGYLMLRSCFADDPLLAFDRAAPWVRYPFFAIALSHWVITDRVFSRRLLLCVGITCGLLVADTFLQYFTRSDILGNDPYNASRLTGPFRQPRVGHTLAWIALPVILCCLRGERSHIGASLLKLAFGIAVLAAIILSGERSPTLLTLLGLGLGFLLLPALRRKLLWLVPLSVLALSSLLYFNPVIYERQVMQTQHVLEHFWQSPYGKIARDSGRLIADHPVFGIGVQHYRVATAKGSNALAQGHPHPHNFYLEVAVEGGVLGLLLLFAVFGSWIQQYILHAALWRGDYLMTGLIVAILSRLWPVISNPGFYASWNVIPLWLMVGWYFALQRHAQATLPR